VFPVVQQNGRVVEAPAGNSGFQSVTLANNWAGASKNRSVIDQRGASHRKIERIRRRDVFFLVEQQRSVNGRKHRGLGFGGECDLLVSPGELNALRSVKGIGKNA